MDATAIKLLSLHKITVLYLLRYNAGFQFLTENIKKKGDTLNKCFYCPEQEQISLLLQ
jgi:hypothetical protein